MTEPTNEIFQIIAKQNLPELELWLSKKPNLELKNKKGETPLMAATYLNQMPMVSLLIAAGANVNAQDNMLNSPFLYAGASGYLDIVKLCLKAGADYRVFNRYNGTALIPACEKGHVAVVEELLKDKTYPIDHINRLGWTALLEAVILGDGGPKQVKIIQLLVDAGANIAIKDKDGVTSLAHARNRNFKEIVNVLEKAASKK
ncbi:ankyrin repeat domain-containing protein [Pedobacter gandavensis]|uniref:ankyrin repeat domain-containing protein n=1 Tax=Pedobacter gandavensis TaxID=2679963 RepID=UPI0029304817|nr:ankyrin repeat domain-containing protein [Pedobacter gandavensis]